MKAKYLFPHVCRIIGWVLVIPGFILGIPVTYADYEIPGFTLHLRENRTLLSPEMENLTNELALTLVIVGLVLVAFSRIRREDELTGKLRLNALYWAILINVIIASTIGGLLFVVENLASDNFKTAIEPLLGNLSYYVYNLFMPLVIFIARFYYLLLRSRDAYDLKPLKFLPYKPYNLIGKAITLPLLALAFSGIITDFDILTNLFVVLPLPMLLWAYTRERQEDEYISAIRLDAMQIAVYVNYLVLLISNLLCYGLNFLVILIVNMSTIPFIFLVVFHFRLWRLRREDTGKQSALLT